MITSFMMGTFSRWFYIYADNDWFVGVGRLCPRKFVAEMDPCLWFAHGFEIIDMKNEIIVEGALVSSRACSSEHVMVAPEATNTR